MPRTAGADAGFTLPEVLIAVGLLVTALVALASLFAVATGATAASGDLTRAAVFAQQTIEELRAPGAPPVAGSEHREDLDSQGRVLPAGAPPGQAAFTRRWRVEPMPGAPVGTVLVRVEVTRAGAVRGRVPVVAVAVRRTGS